MRIFIVDDHESVRDSYRHAFEQREGYEVVGGIADAAFADIACRETRPDLVLMDICTETGSSGLEATALIKCQFPHIKVVVMTGFNEISYIDRAKSAGADAFVYKSSSFDSFVEVIHQVMEGKQCFPQPAQIPVPAGEIPFTEREKEVLRLICRDASRQEVARELCISEGTVKRHIENMLAKTGYKSLMALVAHVIAKGWINPSI